MNKNTQNNHAKFKRIFSYLPPRCNGTHATMIDVEKIRGKYEPCSSRFIFSSTELISVALKPPRS